MNWFRFYHEALDDPKVQRLDGETFKVWVNLLCLASRARDRGTLPSVVDIAFALRMDEDETRFIIVGLVDRGLIEPLSTGGFAPHNWHDRQPRSDDINARVRKHRGVAKPDETLHETLLGAVDVTEQAVTCNGAEEIREEEIRTDKSSRAPTPNIYTLTNPTQSKWLPLLGDKAESIERKFGRLSPEFTDGMVRGTFLDAEAQAGPVTSDQLQKGLQAAYLALQRSLAAEKSGGKPIGNLRPYAARIVATKVREAV